jgi:hypothetical protein
VKRYEKFLAQAGLGGGLFLPSCSPGDTLRSAVKLANNRVVGKVTGFPTASRSSFRITDKPGKCPTIAQHLSECRMHRHPVLKLFEQVSNNSGTLDPSFIAFRELISERVRVK